MSVTYAGGEYPGGYGGRRPSVGARAGDLLCPNPRGAVSGYAEGEQHKDNHRDGSSRSSELAKQYHGVEGREEMHMEGRGEEDSTTKGIRIYVGGLGESVTSDDLRGTFSKMGIEIEAVDIIRTKGRSFAYINFSHHSQNSLSKLFNTYNGCVWKGGRLRLEKAKEHYLDRLKREWHEDAQEVNNKLTIDVDSSVDNIEPLEKPKKDIREEKKQLRIFFPKLQKVKSIAFNGTGKHKYSFRRVEVPSLPTYFCDCEEHCGPVNAAETKRIPMAEEQGSGMNEEEIDIMNSVMNKLFEMENVCTTAHTDVQITKEEDYSIEETNDMQLDEIEGYSTADEDNLIINVVRRGRETTKPDQDLKLNRRQASNSGPTQPVLKKKKRNHEENNTNKHVSTVSGGKESLEAQLNVSGLEFGAQHIESQSSIKQSAPSVSWSQKSSWRELVGGGSNTSIRISDIIPGASSRKNEQSKYYTSANSNNEKKKKKKIPMHETQRDQLDKKVEETVEAQPIEKDSVLDNGETDQFDKVVEGTEKAQPTTMDSASDKGARDHLDKKVEEAEEAQPTTKTDSAAEKGGRDQLDKKVEGTEEDWPTKTESSSDKGGRGSAWLHKSSWTQLVASNNRNSFSITQILPSIAFDKQEPAKPDGTIITESRDNMSDDMNKKGKSESAMDGSREIRIGRESDVQRTTEPSPPIVGNNIASAPMASKYNSAAKQQHNSDVANGETCMFKRTDASLKEWAKIKAALSGSRKKTSKEK